MTAAWWVVGGVTFGALLIVVAAFGDRILLRRRRTDVSEPAPVDPAPVEPADFPTEPLPTLPPVPDRRPWDRLMLRRDELLWHKGAEDDEGCITLGLLPAPAGQLGVLMDVDGFATGVRLDRFEVQGLRDALTNHLVTSSRPVTR